MRKLFHYSSVFQEQDQNQKGSWLTPTVEPLPFLIPKTKKASKENTGESFNIYTDMCNSPFPNNPLPDAPAKLQESVLCEIKWRGRIIEEKKDSLIVDLKDVLEPQKCLKMEVRKDIVEGDMERINRWTEVVASYRRVRSFQGVLEKRISVRLREPAEMPVAVIERELEVREERFSYMFQKKEQ